MARVIWYVETPCKEDRQPEYDGRNRDTCVRVDTEVVVVAVAFIHVCQVCGGGVRPNIHKQDTIFIVHAFAFTLQVPIFEFEFGK